MKHEIFNKELEFIEDTDVKNFTIQALNNLPDYFFEVAASSTGKFHPQYALGKGGLVRHTKAAVRFANHMLQLEHMKQEFNEVERSCIISALILHDGWKHGETYAQYTTHEHPNTCADWIATHKFGLKDEVRLVIANAVATHMGAFTTSKRSSVILEKPSTNLQKFVHMCDYLASRKDLIVQFDKDDEVPEQGIDEYVMPFGKYKGEKVTLLPKDYLEWMWNNLSLQEPLQGYVRTILGK